MGGGTSGGGGSNIFSSTLPGVGIEPPSLSNANSDSMDLAMAVQKDNHQQIIVDDLFTNQFSDDDGSAEDNNNLINIYPSVPFEWLGISSDIVLHKLKS